MRGILILALFVLPIGCVTHPNPQGGSAYTNLNGPKEAISGNQEALKRGESCAKSFLGLFAWGDASIESAREAGKIERIATVDYKHFSIVEYYDVYIKTCTIVTGT